MNEQEMLKIILNEIQELRKETNAELQKVNERLGEVERETKETCFILENETNKQIRMLNLESRVRQLEAKITQSA